LRSPTSRSALLQQRAHPAGSPQGGQPEEIMEAIWVAAEMGVGGADAHATLALQTMSAASSDETTP
jgi:alkylhydroperoxidase/carboxymuconolactone decarboxylase family protein YurZ